MNTTSTLTGGPAGASLDERFAIEREVGRGAAGIVYRATDVTTGEPVALKMIRVMDHDAANQARVMGEGEILSSLVHPAIVRVVSFGALDRATSILGELFEVGSVFIAMEWLAGEDLQARQRRAPLGLGDAVDVMRRIAGALAVAHAAGVVHRDVKPSNIFLLPTTSASSLVFAAKLVDFGVAAASDLHLTSADAVVGTPAYMSPEQARGDATTDARSDVYSLGASLFELVAGRPPHVGPNSIATLARLVTSPAPRLSDLMDGVPPRLDELVSRMLQADRQARPGSAAEVEAELGLIGAELGQGSPAAATPRRSADRRSIGTRLVTTLVALHAGSGEARQRRLDWLRERGADAMPLGSDAIVAHLGARRAHGDEASRALELGLQLSAGGARVGVATGRTHVDLDRAAGDIVDRASAFARDADAGCVRTDATTSELGRDDFVFELVGRGIARVTQKRERSAAADPAARFVGREAELATASAAYRHCVEGLTPVVLVLSGPPGIGKSRLARAFIDQVVGEQPAVAHAEVRCDGYARSFALAVATHVLRRLLRLPKDATLDQAHEELAARGVDDPESLLARLFANQPLPDGVDSRGALYVAMTDLALAIATRGPIMLTIEDAQWSDPESIEWVEHVVSRAAGRSLFVLMMVRPAFWRENPQRFAGRDHLRLELRPLARKATREIARRVIGPSATEGQLDQVAQQAAGSPLYAEELARVIAAGKDASTAPTIEAAIQVSLDALDDVARDALVQGSVFGTTLWEAGLTALGTASSEAALAKLVAGELLEPQASSRFSSTREYLFKHKIVRDVAFASTGEEQRRRLHASAARWLATVGEDDATIAHHYDLGGLHTQAAQHWEAAARRALATNSLRDAVSMADRALTFAEPGPGAFARAELLEEAHSRLDARASDRESAVMAMADNVYDEASELKAMGASARYDHARARGVDVEERLHEVRERARALGLADEEARCSATLAHRYAFAGQLAKAEEEAAHLIDLSKRPHGDAAAVDAWQVLAVVHQTRGRLASALDARRQAAQAARVAGLKEREAMLTMNLGFALTTIGAKSEALEELQAGLTKAHAIGSSGAVRHGQMNLLGWASTFGADASLDAALAEPRAAADDAAGGMWVVHDRVTLGVLFYRGCELLRGEPTGLARARSLLETAANAYRSTENRDVLPVALGFWAEAERRRGQSDKAIAIAREAAELVEQGAPSLLNEAPIYLVLHDACVDAGDLVGARTAMERAMPPLVRRLHGLEGTSYARNFLLGLAHNAGLIHAAEAYGCIPPEIERLIEGDASPS